jgi:hypothetical protein
MPYSSSSISSVKLVQAIVIIVLNPTPAPLVRQAIHFQVTDLPAM